MRKLVISLGRPNNFAKVSKTIRTSWPKLAEFLSREPPETDDKTSVGWYCGAHFEPGYRDGKNFVARHVLTFDYDEIDEWDVDEIKATYAEYAHLIYTTASHTEDKPRVRVVFPLSKPCDRDQFACVSRHIAGLFDIEKLARESDTPAQMMFLPSKKPGGIFWSETIDGKWVDVDAILESYDDWRDASSWERRDERDDARPDAEDIPPPDTKRGIVGDFCRAFTVTDAIERFELPYQPGSNDLRWTYIHGSRPDGLRIYDGGLKAHSDHNTDPAHGQTNAFDLVRLHRFGDLDSESERLGITERPSYKAMCSFARELPELQEARVASEFEALDVPDLGTEIPEEGTEQRFKLWDLEELKTLPPAEWMVKGVLPKADLAVVYGPPGSGKSFLTYDIGCAIMRGEPWGNSKARVKQGRVIYIFAEGASGALNRGQAFCRNYGEGDVPWTIRERPNMFDEKDTAALTKAIKDQGGADLVIVDTLNAASPGADENSGKDMTKVLGHCRLLNKHLGAMVLLVHHSGKDAAKGARGWSGLKAAADAEIEITRNGDFRTASITKMKDGTDGVRYAFMLKPVVLYLDEDGDEVTSCYVEHMDPTEVSSADPELPTPRGMYAKRALDTAQREMRDGGSLLMDELVELTLARIPRGEDGKRDTRRQQTIRAIQKLVVDGHLFQHGVDSISVTSAVEEKEWEND